MPPGHSARSARAASGQVPAAGEQLGPVEIGALATVKRRSHGPSAAAWPVHRRAMNWWISMNRRRIGSQIRNNRHMLLAAARLAGAEILDWHCCRQSGGYCGANQAGWQRLMYCSSGGVSMGDLDLIKPLLERTGTMHFGCT